MSDEPNKTSEPNQPDAPPAKNGRRGLITKIALVAAIVAGVVFGMPYYHYAQTHESTDDAYVEGTVVQISPRVAGHVAKVYISDNQLVRTGDPLVDLDARDFEVKLEAARAQLAQAQAAARVQNLDVSLTTVTATASLDNATASVQAAEAQVDAANAAVDAAISQRAQAAAMVKSAQASLEEAQADLPSKQAAHARDLADLNRYQEMAQDNIVSKQEVEHAAATEKMSLGDLEAARRKVQTMQAQLAEAQAALRTANDNISQARTQVAARQAELDQARARHSSASTAPQLVQQSRTQAEAAQARIAQAAAQVKQAELDLSYTHIVAPADGYVTRKNVDQGGYVQVGQPLLALVQRDVWVTANFKETQLTQMKPGQPVEIEVDTYPGVTFTGHVDSIQRGTGARFSLLPPENATGNFVKVVQRVPVKILIDDREKLGRYLLAPGMSAEPAVDIAAEPAARGVQAADASATTPTSEANP